MTLANQLSKLLSLPQMIPLKLSGSLPEETASPADKLEYLVKFSLVLIFNMREFKSPSSKKQMFKLKKATGNCKPPPFCGARLHSTSTTKSTSRWGCSGESSSGFYNWSSPQAMGQDIIDPSNIVLPRTEVVQGAAIQRYEILKIIQDMFAQQSEGIQVAHLYSVPYSVHHQFKKLLETCPKVPKLPKFNGQGSPQEHLTHYTIALGELATDESYLLRYFATSLTGVAFQWYSNLKPDSVAGWVDMQRKFLDRFQMVERKVSLVELCSLKQNKGESTLDFIKRWREFSMRCNHPPAQEDAIPICRKGLISTVNEKLLGRNIKSFDQLNIAVAEIEVFLAEQMAHASYKVKLPKERKQPAKEANVIDFSPGNEAKRATVSPAPKKKSEDKAPAPSLAKRMKTPYSFKKEHTKRLFDLCLDNQLITLPEPKKPSDVNEKPIIFDGDLSEDVIKDALDKACEKSATSLGVAHECGGTDLHNIVVNCMLSWSAANELLETSANSSPLVKEWAKVVCEDSKDANAVDSVPVLYSLLSSKCKELPKRELHIILEQTSYDLGDPPSSVAQAFDQQVLGGIVDTSQPSQSEDSDMDDCIWEASHDEQISHLSSKGSFDSQVTVEEVKKMALSLVSSVPASNHSAFAAGYLFFDLSERLLLVGQLFESKGMTEEKFQLNNQQGNVMRLWDNQYAE
ncbi:hypothetical protein Taro_043447 [Colocasia esculenta]|uniref:Retrotransposon gag domain-containing protein n=1 Tax=Colocasia esculenta TaxID=4460 RepID=A0A843WJG7_COLES|nr:hypothetical protein [Colocasia esculenta]